MGAVAATTATLVVAEVFGPTVQGEGPSTGRRAAFIRLGGCNLSCSWCDTPYTWDATRYDLRAEMGRRGVQEVADQVLATGARLVVLTGGEPLLHQRQPGWEQMLTALAALDLEVETNGTIPPSTPTVEAARFNVSPKLAHSGDPETARIHPAALTAFAELAREGRAAFKFVARHRRDLDEVAAIVDTYRIPRDRVWVMPEGTAPERVIETGRAIADPAIAAGFNVTTRLHTLLWGEERGR